METAFPIFDLARAQKPAGQIHTAQRGPAATSTRRRIETEQIWLRLGRAAENPVFKLLETLTLKVNRPSEFNEPFEFSPVFDEPVARSEVRARLASVLSADAQKR